MPLDMMTYADMQDRFGFVPANHAAPQLFGAELRPVFDERGEEVDGYRRIVRTDTDKTLEVVGKAYAFVDNRVLFRQFEDAIDASGLDTTGMQIGTDYSHEGRRVFRQYLLPAHAFEARKDVPVALRIVMMNSYDGSMKFSGRAGFYSFVCANTSIVGREAASGFALRHTGEIDARAAIAELVRAADRSVSQQERLREWSRIGVSERKALDILNALPKASRAQIDHLVHAFAWARIDEGPQGGDNLWSLFSCLSAWASHGEAARGGMAGEDAGKGTVSMAVRMQREEQVAALIDCEEWKEVETVG